MPPSGLALHSPQASQTHSPPPPAASRPRGCRSVQSAANPSAHGPPPNPIRQGLGAPRPISDPRRCCPRCRREYARLCDLPRCGDPLPCDIHPLRQSTHRENKSLGISAFFFAITDSFLSPQSEKGAFTRQITCIFAPQSAIGKLAIIANRKKVAI